MLNHIDIMGRLVREPELRTTEKGVSVTTFTLAVDRDFNRDQTDFIDCTAWRQLGEFVSKYFHRGSMAVVSGRIQSRSWADKDGKKRTVWDIQCENVYFGESKRNDSVQTPPQLKEVDDDGELLF